LPSTKSVSKTKGVAKTKSGPSVKTGKTPAASKAPKAKRKEKFENIFWIPVKNNISIETFMNLNKTF
jgi:hypothetical protein